MKTYLGDSEQSLGDINNTGHLLDVVNAGLDGASVVGTGSVQDVLVLLDLTLGPLAVSRATVLGNGSEDGKQTEGGNGLLVHHVQLVADSGNGQTGGGGQNGSLGDEGVSGNSVQDRLSLLGGVLNGDVGSRADRSDGRDDRSADGNGRPQPGGAWRTERVSTSRNRIGRRRVSRDVPMALLARRAAIVADDLKILNRVGERRGGLRSGRVGRACTR